MNSCTPERFAKIVLTNYSFVRIPSDMRRLMPAPDHAVAIHIHANCPLEQADQACTLPAHIQHTLSTTHHSHAHVSA